MRKNSFTLIVLALAFVVWRYLGPSRPSVNASVAVPSEADQVSVPRVARELRVPSSVSTSSETADVSVANELPARKLDGLESDMEEVATTLYRENDALRGLDYRVEKVMTEDSRNVLNVDFRSGDLHGNRGVLRYAREEMMNGFNRAAAKRGLTGAVEISFTVDGREVAPTFWEIPTADAGDGPLPDHIRSR